MPSRMLTLVGGPAGMAVVLAALAAPALAQAGGTPGPSVEGGTQYGAPVLRARPARPVARYFRVGPGYVVAPVLPTLLSAFRPFPARSRSKPDQGSRARGVP